MRGARVDEEGLLTKIDIENIEREVFGAGFKLFSSEIDFKLFDADRELMNEALPRLAKISVLWDPATGFRQLRAIEEVAGVMKLEVSIVEVRALAELDAAMAAASRNSPDALVMLPSPIIGGSYQALANFTLQRRLAAVTLFPANNWREMTSATPHRI